ncbi:ECF transporter S component [Miniphocaeibacter halophilus]|uniref:ECF transporter S component n=1 Tax=Miniphocaeibacter halophilus TaxID=2931922 RepID=A0AC61NDB8_9FIRM|nr:ECF transporter S component [Miniphocaeibacter halophilus]QQK08708.1 ECF transporter S component [Miniphocaeibacter halophilus]
MKNLTTKKLTIIGLLTALTIILGLTPLGFIPLGVTKITTMAIPTIIGAIIGGPLVGGFVGLVFGFLSIFQSITSPTILSFMFYNPLVSVLPRVLIGVVSGYLYKLLNKLKLNDLIACGITGAVGSIVNTVGVLGMAYIFFADKISSVSSGLNASTVLIGIAAANAPFEIIANTILVGLIGMALLKSRRKI